MEINVVKRNGDVRPLDIEKIHAVVRYACDGLMVSESEVEVKSSIMFFDGIKTSQIHDSLIKSASELIEVDSPDYSFVAARLLLQKIMKEVTGGPIKYPTMKSYLKEGVAEGRLTSDLTKGFDFKKIDKAIDASRDLNFDYIGIQIVYDRYLIRRKPTRGQQEGDLIELPQHMWMRVAMGLALKERDRTGRAIEFYNILSKFEFISSTPTLFNSGTLRPQMSSCFLNTVPDSIDGIFEEIKDCANMSKWAGGIGTDWTNIRPAGDLIEGTNGKSSGVVPYLKIFNDTAVAVNQGGKRNGAFAAYLEPWHGDVMRFIDLKKNAGDERLRAREIFTAGWFPDLFFERVKANEMWSLFSPKDCPELHELYGDDFKEAYESREAQGMATGSMPAMELWKHWMSALWESGGPWIAFKDECNRRNPQSHVGVIHNANLCTEVTEVTSESETAVCNLGSVNASLINSLAGLARVVKTAVRMLDDVIDLNFYPVEKARKSNMLHRPIGLGVMGWTEFVVKNGVDWESQEHLDLTNDFFETFSFYTIEASMELAKERGAYPTFAGSKWSLGMLPIDTARDLPFARSKPLMNWGELRKKVIKHGMRNSNTMAIAPTATISNIAGTTPCIEPIFKRVYTKENHSGLFNIVDPSLKYDMPNLCKESFEIDQTWIIKAAAVRQLWLDQSQSVNLFAKLGTRGKDLSDWYMLAWELGLKTTYYLRRQIEELSDTVAPTMVVESVLVDATEEQLEALAAQHDAMNDELPPGMCSIDDPSCESCQ